MIARRDDLKQVVFIGLLSGIAVADTAETGAFNPVGRVCRITARSIIGRIIVVRVATACAARADRFASGSTGACIATTRIIAGATIVDAAIAAGATVAITASIAIAGNVAAAVAAIHVTAAASGISASTAVSPAYFATGPRKRTVAGTAGIGCFH